MKNTNNPPAGTHYDLSVETKDFRKYLQQEFGRRCRKNSNYSIRAFARNLGIHSGTLSSFLGGTRKISKKAITDLGKNLGLSPVQIGRFQQCSGDLPKNGVSTPHAKFYELTHDLFVSMSDWYYDAILELTRVSGFQNDPKWIATRLSISIVEANAALERLHRLELLVRQENGRWVAQFENDTNILDFDFTSAAMMKYQQRVLELSLIALENVPKTVRDHTSTTIAIQKTDLKEIKERIKRFRYELAEFCQRPDVHPDSVYQLSVSMFPLTNENKDV